MSFASPAQQRWYFATHPGEAHLTEEERRKLKEKGLYLHGSSHEFQIGEAIKPGGHGATYLSNPGDDPRRITQAEHIASGPFAKYLYAVHVDQSQLKPFDPPNDPVAMGVMRSLKLSTPKSLVNDMHYWVEWPDMPDVVRAAAKHGYNDFRVREPAVQGFSRAITNQKALKIVQRYK